MEQWLLYCGWKLDKLLDPMHGVAFDSTILFVAIQLAELDPDYDPIDLEKLIQVVKSQIQIILKRNLLE